jgi:hypothetical protein
VNGEGEGEIRIPRSGFSIASPCCLIKSSCCQIYPPRINSLPISASMRIAPNHQLPPIAGVSRGDSVMDRAYLPRFVRSSDAFAQRNRRHIRPRMLRYIVRGQNGFLVGVKGAGNKRGVINARVNARPGSPRTQRRHARGCGEQIAARYSKYARRILRVVLCVISRVSH